MARRLQCVVRPYAWGHQSAIPELLGQPVSGEPQAELWMGAHPSAPSIADGTPLDAAIEADAAALLGPDVAARFQGLPMLFKVLAAAEPLSIQAHPSKQQAEVGFARENAAGVPLDSPGRVYRDDNHKPELICALTRFEAKCGFRPIAQTRSFLAAFATDELDPLRSLLDAVGPASEVLASAMTYLLGLSSDDARRLTRATLDAAAGAALHLAGNLPAEAVDDGSLALASLPSMHEAFPDDIGIVVGLLLNHIVLEPGQALFLGPGNLHAYLSGVGMELMANSDNVVRGGLTPKHIDVGELLQVLDCSPITVPVQTPASAVHTFDAPVPEFALTRIDLDAGGSAAVDGPAILILTKGAIEIDGLGPVEKGQPIFLAANEAALLVEGSGMAWVATVGPGQITSGHEGS